MNKITINFFKPSGKFYATEEIAIPDGIVNPFEIVEYVEANVDAYKGMHAVMMLDEDWVQNGYPCMIPADRR